ncbi:MAG: hypothetical protein HC843_04100 [Sphingomonadales bacterium]|nr:hypothetical protein [Sphingomonadales bacterium]
MRPLILSATLPLIAAMLTAAAPQSPNKMRDAFSPLTALQTDMDNKLSGETDGEMVYATISLDDESRLAAIKLVQDDEELRLPKSAYAGIAGARQAWLEERGALTTLVIEGRSDDKDWRLALLFHPEQLWRRRLSVEGERKDQMTFYDRDEDMKPDDMERRKAHSRGFYNNN